MEKKVELLAPAGNYQALVGACSAGADAVYLGGDKFGARAYADNFSKEEICRGLRYAHFYGKKIYLTVNTLIKEDEFSQLYDYIKPFYEAGLDGVIIQDLGVWQYIREVFPDLALHASTQMTITGAMGASFLKEIGAARIVPARELSLTEIKEIKQKTRMELECFIHGAMCYCYSGQCLFSSILGGRSGNRGRCAQPCRLPYHVLDEMHDTDPGEVYPLSLKDMCTIEYLPKLIEAGIDSFKIEGRMKKPEYAAGVTAIYRKYIDIYYERGAQEYQVDEADMDRLRKLYIRSDIQTGYYERINGQEMITLHKPSYLGSDEKLLQEIATKYMQEKPKIPVRMRGVFQAGKPAMLQLEGNGVIQTSYGEIVQQAVGHPMTQEAVLKQLRKMGNSYLCIEAEEIIVGEAIFVPIGQLNLLRRMAIEAFENKVIASYGLVPYRTAETFLADAVNEQQTALEEQSKEAVHSYSRPRLHVTVQTLEQLQAVSGFSCDRIYIDSDLYIQDIDRVSLIIEKHKETSFYLSLPYIVRGKGEAYLWNLLSMLHEKINGFLVRNLESVFWVLSIQKKMQKEFDMVTDTGVYCFNAAALRFLHTYSNECYLPYELNGKECRRLVRHAKCAEAAGFAGQKDQNADKEISMVVYGTIPMMLTANCLKKTTGKCLKNNRKNPAFLQDRYQTIFPVLCNCQHCYNIIYNSVPYSLHNQRKEWSKLGLFAIRLDFVLESAQKVEEILSYYTGTQNTFPITEYTAGHYKRGVE